jgi:transcription antitermination factor NusG
MDIVLQRHGNVGPDAPWEDPIGGEVCWFAVETRPRHERTVALQLENLGFSTFSPLVSQVHRWSDRHKIVHAPLFPRYTFVRMRQSVDNRGRVLRLYGVNGFVGSRGQGTPIPDKQMADVRTLLANDIRFSVYPFFKVGQRVRIHGGCLEGVEGTLLPSTCDRQLLISVEPIQQSLAICIDEYQIEVVQ